MKPILLISLAMMVGCGKAHTDAAKPAVVPESPQHTYALVYVHVCGTNTYANIYQDAELTMPLPNPFTAQDGKYMFYAAGAACASVRSIPEAIDLKPTSDHFDKGWHKAQGSGKVDLIPLPTNPAFLPDKAAVPETPKDSTIGSVDCKEKSNQVNLHLTDRTIVSDCFTLVDAMDKLFAKAEPPPATHHPSLPNPKGDKAKKRNPHDPYPNSTVDGPQSNIWAWVGDDSSCGLADECAHVAQQPPNASNCEQCPFDAPPDSCKPIPCPPNASAPRCRSYPAGDGCNTVTECDGEPITETLAYCGKASLFPNWFMQCNGVILEDGTCSPDGKPHGKLFLGNDPRNGIDDKKIHEYPFILGCDPKNMESCSAITTAPLWTMPKYGESSESIKDGVYEWKFTDPNNRWRCQVTGIVPPVSNPYRDDEITNFTVVCMRPTGVKTK